MMMVESPFKGAPGQSICKAPSGDAHAAASKTIQLLHAGQSYLAPIHRKK